MKKLYTNFPQISPDEPMSHTYFWRFVDNVGCDNWIRCITYYLTAYGFDFKKHKISKEQLKCHYHTFKHYWFKKLRDMEV